MKYRRLTDQQKGFTLLELMIATLIFSVILLLCTFGLVQVGRTYYRGINSSRTQNIARQVIDSIAQSIQFSGSAPTGWALGSDLTAADSGSFCIGTTNFSYIKNQPASDTVFPMLLQKPCGAPAEQRQLLADNMRLTKLSIIPQAGDNFKIVVKVTFGDTDLIDLTAGDKYGNCKGGAGSQFCAASELQTTVHRKLK